LRNRSLIVGLAAAALVISAVRLVAQADSGVVTLEGLAFGVTLGVLLAVIQRMLTVFAERRSEGRAQPYRLVRTFFIQLAFAFAFSLFIGTPIVLGYVAGAAIMLINLALKHQPETSIEKQP
jgi:hypothetical protein